MCPSYLCVVKQNAGCYAIDQAGPSVSPGSLQPAVAPSLPFSNGASSLQTPAAFDMSTQSRRIDFLPNTLNVQNSNSMRLMQGLNGGCVKTETGYPSESRIIFDANNNIVETHGPVEDASVAAFGHLDGSSQQLNEELLGIDSSFGQLGQIPKNFSFPDLSAYPRMFCCFLHSSSFFRNFFFSRSI